MNKPPHIYRSYLLRLRWVENAGHPGWRMTLRATGSDQEIGFERLEELFLYLLQEMEGQKGGEAEEASPDV